MDDVLTFLFDPGWKGRSNIYNMGHGFDYSVKGLSETSSLVINSGQPGYYETFPNIPSGSNSGLGPT